MEKEENALFIIFGGSGDLAVRKLYPALFRLFIRGSLANNFAVIGTSRRDWPDDYYQNVVYESIKDVEDVKEDLRHSFSKHFFYQSNDVSDLNHFQILKKRALQITEQFKITGPWIYYMAVAPQFFGVIADNLDKSHFLDNTHPNRLVIEKPFGHDLQSAIDLNSDISKTFSEEDVYRIDHYLGKEIVQNIVPLRFANRFLKKIWNRDFISNIQITLAESVGVEARAAYYETAGAFRDMVQNHISQLITLLTMNKPRSFKTEDFLKSKLDLLKDIKEPDIKKDFIRGQYTSGAGLLGYREENGVAPDSKVETFVAGKFLLDNEQFKGVPIYFRTGKRLGGKVSRIDIVFKNEKNNRLYKDLTPDVLTLELEPRSGFSLTLNLKKTGISSDVVNIPLDSFLSSTEEKQVPDGYERLVLEVLKGDKTNFVHWHELKTSWKIADKVIEYWKNSEINKDFFYEAGSFGPQSANNLLEKDHNFWIYDPQSDNK